MDNEFAIQIRRKKLGILIRDARQAAGRTKRECAEALGITVGILNAYENGTRAPSLPEVEALAYFLEIPVNHFWGQTSMSESSPAVAISEKISKSLELRQRVIALKLHQSREESGYSFAEISRRTGISSGRLKKFEDGEQPVPVPELELLTSAMDLSIQDFSGGQGPVGEWLREKDIVEKLLQMPEELQHFVTRPINRPYLEIAQKLSSMDVDQLRNVAEGLLDITL